MASPLELQLQLLQEKEAELKKLKLEEKREQRRLAQKRRRSGAPKASAPSPSSSSSNGGDLVLAGAGNIAEGVAQQLIHSGTHFIPPKLDKQKSKELLVLLELSNSNYDLVTSYVLGQGRQAACNPGLGFWDPEVRRRISAGLVELGNGVPFEFLRDTLEVPDNILHNMCRYIAEYHLFHWLVAQNCDKAKGVTPCSEQAFAKASSFLPESAPEDLRQRMQDWFLGGDRGARYWLKSFKQRWDVDKKLLKPGEQMEGPLVERKAAWQQLLGPGFGSAFWEKILDFLEKNAFFGAHFWAQIWSQKWVPISGFQ